MKLNKTALLALAGLALVATRPLDIVSDLGMTTPDVQNGVFNQLTSEHARVQFTYRTRQLAKQISDGSRSTAVRAFGSVVRTYVESSAFRTRYDEWARQKYQVSDGQTQAMNQTANTSMNEVQDLYKQQIAAQAQAFAQMEPSILAMALQSQIQMTEQELAGSDDKKALTAELATLRKLQAMAKTQPAEFKKQYIAHMNAALNKQANNQMAKDEQNLASDKQKADEYRKRLADYKANANPNGAVRKHLRDFIALAESVDFDAKLTKVGSKMEFVNPAYRGQSDNWKLLYRMGREPVMTARDFARTWLQDLDTKAKP